MKTELKMRELTVRAMLVLVWFEVLWAVIFFVGLALQWSGLTRQLSVAFFGSGFCGALLLTALALLNVAVNLNIISKVQTHRIPEFADVAAPKAGIVRTLVIAGSLIALVVASVGFAEWRLYRTRVAEVEGKLESVADSKLLRTAVEVIKADGPLKELVELRDGVSASILSGGNLSLLYPRLVGTVPVYYEVTAWWKGGGNDNAKVSEAALTKFIPTSAEKGNFEKLSAGTLSNFVTANDDTIRAFRRVDFDGAHLVLLIDTSRRSEYSRTSY